MKRCFWNTIFFYLILIQLGYGHPLKGQGYQLDGLNGSRIRSNGIVYIAAAGQTVWVATGEGLSGTSDFGNTWSNYSREQGLGRGSVTALAIRNGMIWTATGFDSLTLLGDDIAGGGLSFSVDAGKTWHWMQQPMDSLNEKRYMPVANPIKNITYDITLTEDAVWIASFAGGLRRSTDMGKTWQVVTVDDLPFNPQHLTHRIFSVYYDGESLWVGTAGGVHKSTDGGTTWTTFSHQNQKAGISGNFVVAIARQKARDRNIIWAATKETTIESKDSTEFMAVSKTEDGGLTWDTVLKGVSPINFAFDDSVVYVATDKGLFKSLDAGETWAVFSQIVDRENDTVVFSTEVNTAFVGADHALWVGTNDGLALSRDGGITWRIFRGFKTPGDQGEPKTYAYPNPFSPQRHNLAGEEGHVRFQYRTAKYTSVTVRVYDFGMNLVRTVVKDKQRAIPGDYAELWNGRNDLGDMVAIGVYFYKIDLSGDGPLWGKVIVVN